MKTKHALIYSGLMLILHPYAAFARSDDVISRGKILSISANSVTVGSLSCPTNGGTEYEDLQGNTIARSKFTVGATVKLVCRGGTAHSLEMERNNGGGSDSGGNSESGSGSSSGSGSGSNDNGNSDTKLKSRLNAIEGVATTAVGKMEYRNKPSGAGRDDRFKITVKIPVPSSVPAASNFAAARALNLIAVLSRDGTPYATCSLGYDHRSLVQGVTAAEHKIDLRYEQKGSKLRLKTSKGRCDTNLGLEGVQSTFPSILAGDTVVVRDSFAGEILSGQL